MSRLANGTLAKNTAWMLAGQGVGYGMRVLYFIVIARLLGVLQYGIVVGAFAMVNLVAEHSRLGSGTVLLRYVSPNRKRFADYWGNTLLITLIMSGILIAALRLIAPHVLDAASAEIVLLTAIGSCMFEQITISSTQVFQALQRMRSAALLNQLTSMLRCIAAVIMLVVFHRANARQWALASMLASAAATIVSLTTVTISVGWPRFQPGLIRRHGIEGAEYAFASSTTSAYNDLDKTMLSHYGMSAANGIYGMAYRIVELAAVPVASLQLAASPRLFQLAENGPHEPLLLGRHLLRRSLPVSVAMAVIMFSCAPLIPIIAGTGFSEGVIALRWLCLIPVFRCVHGVTGSVLTSIGLQRFRTLTQIAAVLLNFLLNLWLIPSHGWLGAAWASLATDGSLALMNWGLIDHQSRHLPASDSNQITPRNNSADELAPGKGPLVSIIIPYFNHPRFVAEAVESARSQQHRNIEIILVDDGSAVAASDILHDTQDVVMIRTTNQGVSAARNLGFQSSLGEFLIFLDSDDRLLPCAIQAHLKLFAEYPEAGLSFGPAQIIDEKGHAVDHPHLCRPRNDYFPMLLGTNPIGCPGGAMLRRQAFLDAGLFDASYRNADDYHLYLRLARLYPFKQHSTCVVEYRKHGGGKSLQKDKMLAAVMRALDEHELGGHLNAYERKELKRGRARWLHTYQPQQTLAYRILSLYFSVRAMLTVSPRHYF